MTKADDPIKGQDCWIGLTGENFKIRGPNYLNDRKKIMSERCVFKCLCCELINSANRLEHFSQNSKSLVQKLRREGYKGFIYVYNIMVVFACVRERIGKVQGKIREYAELLRSSRGS